MLLYRVSITYFGLWIWVIVHSSYPMIPSFATPYLELQRLLVEARQARGLTQAEVAAHLQVPQSFVSKYERGERRLDVVELSRILPILELDIGEVLRRIEVRPASSETLGILELWNLSPDDLTIIVNESPSLRGMLLGYVAEFKLREMLISQDRISYLGKPDDHDRTKKGDHIIEFQGHRFAIESKSLQSRMIEKDGNIWRGKAQVDASDRRNVILQDGSQIATTLLTVGEFDVLAVNCFAFEQEWNFAFVRNSDLPRSRYSGYSQQVRNQLIASLVAVSWPPEPPFTRDLTEVLELLASERGTKK